MGGKLHRITVLNHSPYVQNRAYRLFPPGRELEVWVDQTGLAEIRACVHLRVVTETPSKVVSVSVGGEVIPGIVETSAISPDAPPLPPFDPDTEQIWEPGVSDAEGMAKVVTVSVSDEAISEMLETLDAPDVERVGERPVKAPQKRHGIGSQRS